MFFKKLHNQCRPIALLHMSLLEYYTFYWIIVIHLQDCVNRGHNPDWWLYIKPLYNSYLCREPILIKIMFKNCVQRAV